MTTEHRERTKVFISYSRRDEQTLDRLRVHLKRLKRNYDLDLWDDSRLKAGDKWKEEIEKAVASAGVAVLLISADFLASEFIRENELPPLLEAASNEGAIILPVIVGPSGFKSVPILSDFETVNSPSKPLTRMTKAGREEVFDKITNIIEDWLARDAPNPRAEADSKAPAVEHPHPERPRRAPSKLCDRISTEQWQMLEEATVRAVTMGGMVAMGSYRQEMQWPGELKGRNENEKNPSTIADLQATSAILQAIDPYLSRLARKLRCSLIYLGEETGYRSWMEKNLTESVYESISPPQAFFTEEDNALRLILDGVDGTGCFTRGIPLFCSSVCLIVSNQPRVSAVYDPIHHIIYSGCMSGPHDDPGSCAKAYAWQVATGNRVDLVRLGEAAERKELRKEAIGVHLTRSSPEKLHEFVGVRKPSAETMVERLAKASGAVYAFNSGTVTMVDIAEGALGGFVNNYTNLWDVAPGEVLVRACGGNVTSFEGEPIDYSEARKVSLVAAKAHLHSDILEIVNG